MLQRIFFLPKWPDNPKDSDYEEKLRQWKKEIQTLDPPTEEELESNFTLDKIDGIKNFLERCGP
jgi:hypothetical protein